MLFPPPSSRRSLPRTPIRGPGSRGGGEAARRGDSRIARRRRPHPATRPWRESSFPRYALPMNDKTQHARDFLRAIAERVGDLVAAPVPAAGCAALLNGFKPYLLSEKSDLVAELFLDSYGLLATKGSAQLRRIETNGAFVPGSTPIWKEAVGATLVVARPFILRVAPREIKGRTFSDPPCHRPVARNLHPPLPFPHATARHAGNQPVKIAPAAASGGWVGGSMIRFFKKEKIGFVAARCHTSYKTNRKTSLPQLRRAAKRMPR